MNYFIHDERDLSRAYVKSCKKFLKEITSKQQTSEQEELDKVSQK